MLWLRIGWVKPEMGCNSDNFAIWVFPRHPIWVPQTRKNGQNTYGFAHFRSYQVLRMPQMSKPLKVVNYLAHTIFLRRQNLVSWWCSRASEVVKYQWNLATGFPNPKM